MNNDPDSLPKSSDAELPEPDPKSNPEEEILSVQSNLIEESLTQDDAVERPVSEIAEVEPTEVEPTEVKPIAEEATLKEFLVEETALVEEAVMVEETTLVEEAVTAEAAAIAQDTDEFDAIFASEDEPESASAPESSSEPELSSIPATPSVTEPTVQPPPASPPLQSQTLQKAQAFWQKTQPKLKSQTITTLKATIRLLEGTVARLEAEPAQPSAAGTTRSQSVASEISSPMLGSQPASESNPKLASQSTFESAESISGRSPRSSPTSQPPQAGATFSQQALKVAQQGWNAWRGILPKLRSRLPDSINQLNDQLLTGAIVGILIVSLWLFSAVTTSKPLTPKAVTPPRKTAPLTKSAPTPSPTPQPPTVTIPIAKPSPAASPSPTPSPAPALSPAPSTSPSPAVLPSPLPPKPTPPLKLTPEQKLIARIQDQVAEISDRYADDLIQSVQANFRGSLLTVNMGDRWYSLEPTQQDKLANELLRRAQQLSFLKLAIVDSTNRLLARNPVVGSEMIILQRNKKPAPEPTAEVTFRLDIAQ